MKYIICKLKTKDIVKKKKRNKYISKNVLCECKDVFCNFKNTKNIQISLISKFKPDIIRININNYNIYSNYIWLKLYCDQNYISTTSKINIYKTIFYLKIIKQIYNILKNIKYNTKNTRKFLLNCFPNKSLNNHDYIYLEEIKITNN